MRGVTWRSVLIGLLLLPLNAYWLVQMEVVRYSAHPTTVSLLFNAIFILLILHGLNSLWSLASPRTALTRAELLTIYTMVCIGSCITGHDGLQVLVPMMSWPFRFADPTNNWEALFFKDLPTWLTIRDQRVIEGYYLGATNWYRWEYLRAWGVPLLAWGAFVAVLLWVMICLDAALRRQWLDRERLPCPLVSLPMEITQPKASLFRNRIFWLGFAAAAGMDTWNSIAFHYPWMPRIPIEHSDLAVYMRGRPWSAIGWTPRSFYPFMIGLGVLMPTDFLFSCWFFYLFWKVERILSAGLGLDQIPEFPFLSQQAFGAYMVFLFYGLWLSRRYLAELGRRTIGAALLGSHLSSKEALLDDRDEPLPHRVAVLGALIGFVALVWFSAAAGLRWWVAVIALAIYYALSLAITRMRVQFGAPVHDLHFVGPDYILPQIAGPRAFTSGDLTVFSLYFWFNRAYRNHPMPFFLEGFRIAQRVDSAQRPQTGAMVAAVLAGIASGFWAMLQLMYGYGASAKSRMSFGSEAYTRLASWLTVPTRPNFMAAGAVGVGFVFAFCLETMRLRFVNWPFHPLGFAISGNWEMNLVWMPLMIAWIIKSLLLKYGGFKVLRGSIPFFLGLILGQFVVGSIVNIISIAMGLPSYMFWQ